MPNFKNLIRRAIVSILATDTGERRIQQIQYNGNPIDVEVWAPYGMSYNIPTSGKGSTGIVLQVIGDPGNLIFLPDRSQDRVKNLKAGEVAFFNPLTKSRVVFKENGNIETTTEGSDGDMITTVQGDKTISIGGACNITVDGACNLNADSVNIDASVTNLGVGGSPIARLRDSVSVSVIGVTPGGATIPASGTITSGGTNKSI